MNSTEEKRSGRGLSLRGSVWKALEAEAERRDRSVSYIADQVLDAHLPRPNEMAKSHENEETEPATKPWDSEELNDDDE